MSTNDTSRVLKTINDRFSLIETNQMDIKVTQGRMDERLSSIEREMVAKNRTDEYASNLLSRLDTKVDDIIGKVGEMEAKNDKYMKVIASQSTEITNLKHDCKVYKTNFDKLEGNLNERDNRINKRIWAIILAVITVLIGSIVGNSANLFPKIVDSEVDKQIETLTKKIEEMGNK